MGPRVSVVVPTYRRPELMARCLVALLAQELDPAAYEVIVVDDGDTPETREVVERTGAMAAGDRCRCRRPAVQYLPVRGENHGPAAASASRR